MRILVVEDEPAVARHIQAQLEKSGFHTDISHDGYEACRLGEASDYSAVILDLGLPRLDGLSILRRWRQAGRSMPVIVVTARAAWTERVSGIDAGADDYLIKPFVIEELLARLRAVLRRSTDTHVVSLEAGPFQIDLKRRHVLLEGAPVTLTPLEYRLLVYLCRHANTVMNPGVILEHLHGTGETKDVNALERLIARLRKKIGAEWIETRRGHGYLLAVPK
jgi:two-component system, OmpR family, response regulator